ncbi:hypothetical protein, partial [Klebsiella pneumoniae]|uniref:hypothetical protein n=1 Tax=Klebsiella pneumoniae TaxID=573 RepID=UPI00190F7491
TPTVEHFSAAKYAMHALHVDVAGGNALTEPAPVEDLDLVAMNASRKARGLPPLGPIAGMILMAFMLCLAGCNA